MTDTTRKADMHADAVEVTVRAAKSVYGYGPIDVAHAVVNALADGGLLHEPGTPTRDEMVAAQRVLREGIEARDAEIKRLRDELDTATRRADAAEQLVQVLGTPKYDPNRLQLG